MDGGWSPRGRQQLCRIKRTRDPDLSAKLLSLGIGRDEARFIPSADKSLTVATGDGRETNDVRATAWLIPSQKRLIVAVGNVAEKPITAAVKVNLQKLRLTPDHHGESIIISELETDKVLLQTTGMNRGELLGLWKGLRSPTGEKIASPADQFDVTLPAGSCKYVMITTQ